MKTKKMTPATVAPVKRETSATVSRDGEIAIAPAVALGCAPPYPFAGDDAE